MITITYHFDLATGLHAADRIQLSNGAYATYSSGSNTTSVSFTYTITAGTSLDTANLTQTNTLIYPGNSTTPYSTGYNTAGVTTSAPSTTYAVDNTLPTVTAAASSSGVFHTGGVVTFTLTTSEAVVSSGATLTLSNGETATYDAIDSSATSSVFKYTVLGSDTATADVTITAVSGLKDVAGNTLAYSGNPSGTSQILPCFLRGTHILTSTGEVPVEALRIGDLVQTLSSAQQPVKWNGRRQIKVGSSQDRQMTAPVRIQRSSFAECVPRRDLLVSPDHAIFVGWPADLCPPTAQWQDYSSGARLGFSGIFPC